jgi:predicted phage-related endonuclease
MNLLHPETRAEWLALRKKYVSSTESSALFGLNPYMTAFEMAVSKKELRTEEYLEYGNERMKWGQRLQDAIAQGVAEDYGVIITEMGLTYAVDDENRIGSSFDYQIATVKGDFAADGPLSSVLSDTFNRLGPGLLEIKNVDSLEYKNKWVDDEAPDHIEIQLQHQLEVLGLAWGVIAALVGGNRVGLIVRERDPKVGRIIRSKVRAFWEDFDKGKLPDPMMPDDAAVIVALYQYADPNKVYTEANPELEAQVREYKAAAAAETAAKENKDIAKAKILTIIKDAEKALVGNFTVSAAMRAPAEIAAYTRKGYRDFRINEKKVKA